MAKKQTEKQLIADEKFVEMLEEYLEGKAKIAEINNYLEDLHKQIVSRCDVNEASDFEGTKHLLSGDYDVTLTYKLNRKADVPTAEEMCKEHNFMPSDLFSVEYKYSKTKMEHLTEEERALVKAVLAPTTRSKTSVDIKKIK